ncbi:MAG: glycerate kinase [Bacilli bacterium]|nr:glycerate kinase [Bacilli bacterium]
MEQKKIVIASDSFKGTLTSLDICCLFHAKTSKINGIFPIFLPIADGGEGSLEAISNATDGRFEILEATNLYFQKMRTRFFVDEDNNAYIETASTVGLTMARKDNNPGLVTTYGLGEQIKKAIDLGIKNIYLFLGGSASNDGGVGLASALGVKFYDENDKPFTPTGLTLKKINRIDNRDALKILEGINLVALSDVASPFYGIEGAAYKFGPQKGATPEQVKELDDNLRYLSDLIKRDLNIDISSTPGAGAAGGLGGGLVGLLNASIKSGINTLLDLIHFDEYIQDADYVISGEGKLDKQTLDGKVIDGVAKRCLKVNKPLIIVVGISELSLEEIKKIYPCVTALYETNKEHLPYEKIKGNAKNDYLKVVDEVIQNLN